ncbi:hypothetical protein BDY19DRAFT_81403 [Irpex rosettiformis]|uniref:Uncharacterized protein n=1 Tax=Irpex rosettiformis TaxID=378272 RepID=A0ACB8UNT3_9APHY|nr:hypothetical protein BDY19DRAFT_81403 [Irpex rosettiformis]
MRSPVIAFGIFAAAAVSPNLVAAAPASPALNGVSNVQHVTAAEASPLHQGGHARRQLPVDLPPVKESHTPQHSADKKHESKPQRPKRALDGNTAGGNAFSGGTSDATGGTIVNESDDDQNTITNNAANAAGTAGESISGDAEGGRGRGFGPGGNAYSGAASRASGGNAINDGGDIANTTGSNVGGNGNASESGDAFGGNAVTKRAYDPYTAGGNAYTGSAGDTSSGSIVNEADSDATITNTGPGTNFGTIGGDSTTGDAEGGRGNGKGPGGNAYSGFAGPTRGGNVVNEGGNIGNTAVTNTGGNGGNSLSGEADGGDA